MVEAYKTAKSLTKLDAVKLDEIDDALRRKVIWPLMLAIPALVCLSYSTQVTAFLTTRGLGNWPSTFAPVLLFVASLLLQRRVDRKRGIVALARRLKEESIPPHQAA